MQCGILSLLETRCAHHPTLHLGYGHDCCHGGRPLVRRPLRRFPATRFVRKPERFPGAARPSWHCACPFDSPGRIALDPAYMGSISSGSHCLHTGSRGQTLRSSRRGGFFCHRACHPGFLLQATHCFRGIDHHPTTHQNLLARKKPHATHTTPFFPRPPVRPPTLSTTITPSTFPNPPSPP